MSFASRSRELLWRLGVRPALAHASRPVRATLEAPELLQHILEFLPIDEVCGPAALRVPRRFYYSQLYHKKRGIKAVSRAFCYAARRALTCGRWRPIRLLEQPRGHEQGVLLMQEATRGIYSPVLTGPCPALLREAWGTDRGACILMLITNPAYQYYLDRASSLGCKFLQLVEPDIPMRDPDLPIQLVETLVDSSAFRRIMSAFEYAFGILRSGDLLFALLHGWLHWQEVETLPGFEDDEIHTLRAISKTTLFIQSSPQLGRLLEAWSDPQLAGAFVVAIYSFIFRNPEGWEGIGGGTLNDYGARMSRRWEDRDKARRFLDVLRSQHDLRDEAAARAREADAAGLFDVETAETWDEWTHQPGPEDFGPPEPGEVAFYPGEFEAIRSMWGL